MAETTWARILTSCPCPPLFEFGTKFLPPETGALKRDRKSMSPRRAEIGDHHARELAAKPAFLVASYQLRVSEDWVVGRRLSHEQDENKLKLCKRWGEALTKKGLIQRKAWRDRRDRG
jgi:hypothetical protein